MTHTRGGELGAFFIFQLLSYYNAIWRLLCLLSFKLQEDLHVVNNLLHVKTILLVLTKYLYKQ